MNEVFGNYESAAFENGKPKKVDAWTVTRANCESVARWCGGEAHKALFPLSRSMVRVATLYNGIVDVYSDDEVITKDHDTNRLEVLPRHLFDDLYKRQKRTVPNRQVYEKPVAPFLPNY